MCEMKVTGVRGRGGDQTRKGGRRRGSISPYDFRARCAGPSQLGVGVGVWVLLGVAIGIGMRERGAAADLYSAGGRPRPMALLGVAYEFSSGIPLNFRGPCR